MELLSNLQRSIFCRTCCVIVFGAAMFYAVTFAVAEPADTTKQESAKEQSDQATSPIANGPSAAQQSQTVVIPLKSIWGGRLQGARMFGQFDLDMPSGIAAAQLGSDINNALITAPMEAAKPGFIVLGKSGEALQGAHEVLVESKKPPAPIPGDSEVSLVFFAYGSSYSAHLHDVEVDGRDITVRYQFVPESVKDMQSTYALISLGKLSAGDYHVKMVQLPMDQKFIQRGSKPPSDEDVRRLVCQSYDFSVQPNDIAYKEVGQLDGIGGAEFRFGTRDRMIFVDDLWELDRCARLIPDLPWADLRKESLLIVMNWKYRARSIESIHAEGNTMVIRIKQEIPPGAIADSYHPPKYLVARLPVWTGPVRFEVNGKRYFTIVRGEELNKLTDQIWEEILRLHSGGKVNRIEYVKYLRWQSPNITDQEAIDAAFDKNKLFNTPAAALYPILFEELVNIRARPVIPRIFEMLKATGKFDPILEHTNNALIGIGGPELVARGNDVLESLSPRYRETALGALATIGDPVNRPLAYRLLNGSNIEQIRGGLSLLKGIGPRKEDVGAIASNMERMESLLFDPQNDKRFLGFSGSISDEVSAFIYTLADLGAQAEDALPVLEQMATKPRYPLSTVLQGPAQKAVEKIKQSLSKDSPKKSND